MTVVPLYMEIHITGLCKMPLHIQKQDLSKWQSCQQKRQKKAGTKKVARNHSCGTSQTYKIPGFSQFLAFLQHCNELGLTVDGISPFQPATGLQY